MGSYSRMLDELKPLFHGFLRSRCTRMFRSLTSEVDPVCAFIRPFHTAIKDIINIWSVRSIVYDVLGPLGIPLLPSTGSTALISQIDTSLGPMIIPLTPRSSTHRKESAHLCEQSAHIVDAMSDIKGGFSWWKRGTAPIACCILPVRVRDILQGGETGRVDIKQSSKRGPRSMSRIQQTRIEIENWSAGRTGMLEGGVWPVKVLSTAGSNHLRIC